MKPKTFNGILELSDNKWIVNYFVLKNNQRIHKILDLHPDNVNQIDEWNQMFDNIIARILQEPNIKFTIINNYAKIKR
jgi:hypothetical protein